MKIFVEHSKEKNQRTTQTGDEDEEVSTVSIDTHLLASDQLGIANVIDFGLVS